MVKEEKFMKVYNYDKDGNVTSKERVTNYTKYKKNKILREEMEAHRALRETKIKELDEIKTCISLVDLACIMSGALWEMIIFIMMNINPDDVSVKMKLLVMVIFSVMTFLVKKLVFEHED